VSFSHTRIIGSTQVYYSKQNKIKQTTKTKTLQEQHISHEAIKILCIEKLPGAFVDEEGMPWESPSFDACTS
jgi:hypothetical protein